MTTDERIRLCCILQPIINRNLALKRFDAAKHLIRFRRTLTFDLA